MTVRTESLGEQGHAYKFSIFKTIANDWCIRIRHRDHRQQFRLAAGFHPPIQIVAHVG